MSYDYDHYAIISSSRPAINFFVLALMHNYMKTYIKFYKRVVLYESGALQPGFLFIPLRKSSMPPCFLQWVRINQKKKKAEHINYVWARSTFLTGKVAKENVISWLYLHKIYQILRFIYITTKEPQRHSLTRLEKAFS